ncbi:MAG: hypothetical protein HYW24_02720 [Candidatus Aenigmarchaeota archaeon]|nr:hypothetical protein [Candidatus Aenigmarchaeota archaeon]
MISPGTIRKVNELNGHDLFRDSNGGEYLRIGWVEDVAPNGRIQFLKAKSLRGPYGYGNNVYFSGDVNVTPVEFVQSTLPNFYVPKSNEAGNALKFTPCYACLDSKQLKLFE